MAEASHDRESDLMSNGQGNMGLPNIHHMPGSTSGSLRQQYLLTWMYIFALPDVSILRICQPEVPPSSGIH